MLEIGTLPEFVRVFLPVIYSLIISHLLAIIANYGMIYAALYRSDLSAARGNVLKNIGMAAFLCLPGLFTTFSILSDANAISYGIKFWPVETKRFSKKWYRREQGALMEKCEPTPKWRPRQSPNAGRCNSIW